jgi:LysM repeat protein
MREMKRSRPAEVVIGLTAGLALVAVLVGIPVALALLGGDPLPNHLPRWSSIRDSLTQRDETGTLFIHAIVIIGWLAWASFVLSVIVEIVARLRGRTAVRLTGLGGPQRWAAGLIAAVALSISASSAGLAMPHAAVAAVATTIPDHPGGTHSAATGTPVTAAPRANYPVTPDQSLAAPIGAQEVGSEASTPDSHLVYQVRKGDYLGRIAERFGGPFDEATEIARENHIKDPNVIDIGWKITLPSGAEDTGPHRHATGRVIGGSGTHGSGDSEAPPTVTPRGSSSASVPSIGGPAAEPPVVAAPARGAAPMSTSPSVTVPAPVARDSGRPSTREAIPPPAAPAAPPAMGTSTRTAGSSAPPSQKSGEPSIAGDSGLSSGPTDGPATAVVGEMLAASGTVAAVVSLAVVVMRRRDQVNQRLGRASVTPATGSGAPRLMDPTRVEDVVRLDTALRVLSDRVADWPVDDVPQVAGVWLDHGTVTLLLADQPRSAPAPFVDDPNGWRLDAGVSVASPTAQIAPLPLLAAVGGRDRQHVLLDLEYLRVLGLGGDSTEAMNVMRFIVAELCHNVWADDVRVTLAGFGPEAAALSAFDPVRVRVEPSVPAAVAAFHGRLADAVANLHDVRPPDVLLVAAPAIGDHAALAALERDLMATPGVGMAAVIAPTPEGLPVGKYQMNVGGGGDLHIGFLGDAVMPAASLPAPLVDEVVMLIGEARAAGDPSPLDLARAASRAALDQAPGGRAAQFAGQRRQDPAARSFRSELEELTRGQRAHPAGLG